MSQIFTMKKIFTSLLLSAAFINTQAQITITAADMPVSGDTLRYSIANPIGSGFSAADSGVSKMWDFSMLTANAQGVDTFKKATSVNITYGLTISPTAYGYKVADSFPIPSSTLPISIKEMYTFFNKKSSPSRFVAQGFAAKISSIPTPVNYSDEDEWYYFPLDYNNTNSSTFALDFSLPTIGSMKMSGTRLTRVDAWGKIKTPYFTTATDCIRVRTVVDEIDSVKAAIINIGIPRKTVEYKFLVNGEHYPALWVTATVVGTTETITSIRYRDTKRATTSVSNISAAINEVKCFPNPVAKGVLNLEIPQDWKDFSWSLYDVTGANILSAANQHQINMATFSSGAYVLLIQHDATVQYLVIQN